MTTDQSTASVVSADEMIEPVIIDYFGFEDTDTWKFPDGVQYFVLQAMNEGAKTKYQQKTNSDVVLERGTGNARMKMDAAAQRHELILASVVDGKMYRRNPTSKQMEPLVFNKRLVSDWLEVADPKLVEDLEKAIRKLNPWLLGEMSSADIKREIANLEEMLQVALEREAGEAASSSR